jgi:hypothetical protein
MQYNIGVKLFVAFALVALSVPAFGEPKAYDLVRYRGKAEGLTIAFDFGNGYPQASEVRIAEGNGRKSKRFVLDESGEMHFVPEKDRSSGEGVTLKMSPDDAAPAKVEGIYRAGGKAIFFSLTRR